MKVDMGWKGPLGNDLQITGARVYLHGTNHWLEAIHHVMPFSSRREIRWAQQLVDWLDREGRIGPPLVLSGHSLGGTVAEIATRIIRDRGRYVSLYTYGAKLPPKGYQASGLHYRVKGDPVPDLPPWRPRRKVITLDYGRMTMIEAHNAYSEIMRQEAT